MVNKYGIWQSSSYSISQSYDFPLPGYLFVECTSGARSVGALGAEDSAELGAVLKHAERITQTLIEPARIYLLKFGESDQRVHFHVIPRTRKVLEAYLKSHQDAPPYNGALIAAWICANARVLGYSKEQIYKFIQAAREVIAA